MSSGGGTTTQTVQEKADPWKPVQPYLKTAFSEAERLYKNPVGPWLGDTIAAPSPTQFASTQLALDQIPGLTGLGTGAINLGKSMIAGDYLHPSSNPYLTGAIEAAIDPVRREYTNTVIPGISSQAIAQGAFGGSREGVTQAIAANDYTKRIGDMTSMISYENYAQERDRQMMAPGLISQGAQLNLIPSDIMGAAGAQEQSLRQQVLDNARAQHAAQDEYPWAQLMRLLGVLQPGTAAAFGSSVAKSTSPTSGPNPIISGALGGAGLGASIAGTGMLGAASVVAPWAIPIGMALGGLGGFL